MLESIIDILRNVILFHICACMFTFSRESPLEMRVGPGTGIGVLPICLAL